MIIIRDLKSLGLKIFKKNDFDNKWPNKVWHDMKATPMSWLSLPTYRVWQTYAKSDRPIAG